MVLSVQQKNPRYQLSLPVELTSDHGEETGLRLANISLGGLFVRTKRPLKRGASVNIRLQMLDAAMCVGFNGRVVHVVDDRSTVDHPAGVGIEFTGMSEPSTALLKLFLDALVAGVIPTETDELSHVKTLLTQAETVLPTSRLAAVRLAREAARLSSRRDVRIRALVVLAKAGEREEALLLAESILAAVPKDEDVLRLLMDIYESTQRWAPAACLGEALLSVRGDDEELRERVKRMSAHAKKAGQGVH